MSEVSLLDAKTCLKKVVSVIVNINGINSDKIPKLRAQPELVLEAINKYDAEKNNQIKKFDLNNEEINSLKNKISQGQRDIQKYEESIQNSISKRQDLMKKIQEIQKEIEETQTSIRAKRDDLNSRTLRLKDVENSVLDLMHENDKFDSNLKSLEKELEGTFLKKEKFIQSYENRVSAMKILINKKYISSSLYQFIRALQVGNALDLRNILVAIDMRENNAKNIIFKILEDNGPIIYDEVSGTIELKEEVDF
jgi:chromosome segregation ATPase